MIRVVDTNALIELYRRDLCLLEEHACLVPKQIEEEFLGDSKTEQWFKTNYFARTHIDEGDYLAAYARYLNGYSGVSFYNLKGFGDVAILAILDLLVSSAPRTLSLSDDLFPQHSVRLVTDDNGLGGFARKTFDNRVIVERSAAFIATAF